MTREVLLRRAALILGTGYILFFFSERVFWSMWRSGDEFFVYVAGWLFYSFLAYLLLAAIREFHVHDAWALLLAGALFGWVDEGVFAMTLFGDASMPFPLTIAWTGLAWHAPLTVVFGWYWLRRALQAPRLRPAVLSACAIGVFWGFWASGWSGETPPVEAEPLEFLAHAAAATAGLALSQWALTFGAPRTFRPSRAGLVIAIGSVLVFFGAITIPTIPHAPLIVVPLFAILFLALRRNRRREPDAELLAELAGPVPARNLFALALIPIIATCLYSGLTGLGVAIPSHHITAAVTILGGSGLFIAALYRQTRFWKPLDARRVRSAS